MKGLATKLKILCLLNDPLEKYDKKGTLRNYLTFMNPRQIFSRLYVIYRFPIINEDFPAVDSEKIPTEMRVFRVPNIPVLGYLFLLIRVVLVAKANRPSLIRAYNPQVEGLAAVICKMITKIPVVVSVHSDYTLLVNLRKLPVLVRHVVYLIERFVYKHSTRIFCVSSGIAEYVVRMGASPEKVRIVYNRIKVERFRPSSKYKTEMRKRLGLLGQWVFLYVGRFHLEKNIPTLLRAVSIVKTSGYDIHLFLVGGESGGIFYNEQLPIIDGLVKELNIKENVTVTGYLPNEELPKFYGMADAFIFPSAAYGFGKVLVEAQAAGLPIIASKILYVGDKGDVISPDNALLFDTFNPNHLSEKMIRLIEDKELWERLAHKSVSSSYRYAWDRMEKLESRLYREILESNNYE